MVEVLVAVCLNASFWVGIGILVASRIGDDLVGRVLATAVAGFTVVVVSLEILGLVGLINRTSLATICGLTGAFGLVRWATATGVDAVPGPSSNPPAARPTGRLAVLSLVVIALAVWAALLYLLFGLVFPVEPVSDAPIYHLHFAVRWMRSGSLALVPTPFGEEAATYFPANGDLWLTWLMATGMGPLVKVGQWPFLVVGATALYGLARRAEAPWPAALLPAALWATLPIILLQSSMATVDLVWTAFYFIAAYFLLQWLAASGSDDRGPMLLFGLAAGIVLGTKAIGGVFVGLLLVPVVGALACRAQRGRHLAWLTLGLFVPSAYWYGRNVWLTGNPLYPLELSLFGRVFADGWYGRSAMVATAYHVPVGAWPTFVARLWLVAGGIGLALAVIGMASGWAQALRPSTAPGARRALGLFSGVAAAQGLLYWYVIPYNTQERFLSTAFGFAFLPLAAVVAGQPILHTVVCLLLGGQLLASLLRLHDNPLAVGSPWVPLALPGSILLAALALTWTRRARGILAGAVVVLGCYVATRPAATWLAERPWLRFYPRTEFAIRLWPGWEILERVASATGSRIAYTGTNLPYYLLGIGLRNEVEYVNINTHLDWLPHDYHRARPAGATARDPWPQWYRTEADFESWLANLRRRQIEFLFVARENRHGRLDVGPEKLAGFPIEKEWADAHPEGFVDLGPFRYPPGVIPWVRVYRVLPAQ